MKNFSLFLLLCCFTTICRSQTAASYCFSASAGTFSSISGVGVLQSGVQGDDVTLSGIGIGFTFRFGGVDYTTLSVNSNGWLSLANSALNTPTNAAANITGAGMLMPFWDDANGAVSGAAYSYSTGIAPNRVFTFEWSNWPTKPAGSGGTGNATYQVKLYETSNIVQFVYGASTYSTVSGSIGIANSTADYLSLNSSSASPTASSAVFTTSITTAPVSGTTYTFSPQAANVYAVTGGGGYCTGGAGMAVGLSSSDAGVRYQLYNGAATVGSLVTGTGSAISFGLQTATGTYSVVANPGTACAMNMSGTAVVLINPSPMAYSVTGGGGYCNGGTGTHVGLSFSNTGVNYQLFNGATAASGLVGGTGAGLDFGLITVAGTYTVQATIVSTSCTAAMTGSTTVSVNPLPAAFAVTGGGGYCTGGTGVVIGLGGSASGINYQLYNGASAVGSQVAGTNAAISFGLQTGAGTYTVLGINPTTTCTVSMTGSTGITINPLPAAFNVTGGGSYCAGGAGVHINLSGSVSGVTYQLFQGATPMASVTGTNVALDFGVLTTAGTYTAVATNSFSCTANMNSSANVTINTLPNVYTVTGGGAYCAGGAGVHVLLSNSTSGVNYQLYNGAATVGGLQLGSGSGLDFGFQTTAGTYTVQAINAVSSCTATMAGSAPVTVNTPPAAFAVTGGGTYCAGGAGLAVGLLSSVSGVNYQLYNGSTAVGSPVAGTNAAISFGLQTSAGIYSVIATTVATGCTSNMTGTVSIAVNPAPFVYAVSGGGSYCAGGAGVHVTISGSNTGINYQLYNGATTVGGITSGTGTLIDFGFVTGAGTYTVLATNSTTTCTANMSGSATITVNTLPLPFTVTGGGSYCAGGTGVTVALSGSASGVSYQLYNGFNPVGTPVAGTGLGIGFGAQTAAGTYSVVAINGTTTCINNMTGTVPVSVNSAPLIYTVTGGGGYCTGGTGVNIGLSNSTSGVSYQLYNGAATAGSAVTGTGSGISFGAQLLAGTYTVLATNPSSCSSNMSGNAVVSINSLPTTFAVSGGGGYCAGSGGVHIGLSGSASGVNYQLYNGTSLAGLAVAGTNSVLDFGLVTGAGTYTVRATNATTGCGNDMTGSTTISINPLPATFTVSGGGNYCAGGTGVNIGLSGSASGVSYQLYNGATAVGTALSGTGAAISFGPQTVAGTYSVLATGASCSNAMSGTATVAINLLPVVYTVGGGGSYCAGGMGVQVTLSFSTIGINYQLFNGATATGLAVGGNGGPLNIGFQTVAGNYTAIASNPSTGCSSNMAGVATVAVNPLPTAYAVTGGGSYCSGGAGVVVGLAGSVAGTNYQLYNGAAMVGSVVAGTGSALNFGSMTLTGTYSVIATIVATGCSGPMSGTVSVGINPSPATYSVTGGGNYCAGGAGVHVNLNGSVPGVNYQLYYGTTPLGSAMAGTGSALDYGLQLSAGVYSVSATNAVTGCTTSMLSSATVAIDPQPTAFSVTGGGAYCAGGSGYHIGLAGSQTGVSYQMYRGTTVVGSAMIGNGAALDFGIRTIGGNYTIVGTSMPSGCTATMSGSATITVNALPLVYTVTGGGHYCAGGAGANIGLNGSQTGVDYTLYRGAIPVTTTVGTGAAISLGSPTGAGTYSVVATVQATGCPLAMTGSTVITIDPLPVAYTVSGGGSYCAGGAGLHIILNSSQSGVSYQLYNGATTINAPMAGTGAAIDFGLQAVAGTYPIVGTITATGCSNGMVNPATININALPDAYTVAGSGAICAGASGLNVTLSGSQTSVNYQLYRGSVNVGAAVPGTGNLINFVAQSVAGVYSVLATSAATGCSAGMSGTASVVVNALPVVFAVTGGGNLCVGDSGLHVGLSGSAPGISYVLYNGATVSGSPLMGTGAALDFGLKTTSGVYSVVATNTISGCTVNMSGAKTIVVNALPTVYPVFSSGTSFCAGSAGLHIFVGGSQTGVNYQLWRGSLTVGAPVAGSGSNIDFGSQTIAGPYFVVATRPATGCAINMSGVASIVVNPLPIVYSVGGGGSYCAGGAGVHVTISGSQSGIRYQLYNGIYAVGSPVTGGGTALDFGLQTAEGTYWVAAANAATTCSSNMAGSALVIINQAPNVYVVTGGGSYCVGGAGVNVGLSGSVSGVNYQLFRGASPVGAPVAGTNSALNLGTQMVAGTYTVMATNANTCRSNMTGDATIVINALPDVFAVTGGGSICAGEAGVHVGLANSVAGINYKFFRGSTLLGSPYAGTGLPIDFGVMATTGIYSVTASDPATGCAANMSGTPSVIVNDAPVSYIVTGGGSYCAGGAGVHVGLNYSASGVSYQLYNGTAPLGAPINGTGGALDFGLQTGTGTYTVSASGNATGCTGVMSGSAIVVTTSTVTPTVGITTGRGDTLCLGVFTTFTAIPGNGGAAPTYAWRVNGASVGSGSTYLYLPHNGDVVSTTMTSNATCAAPLTAVSTHTITVVAAGIPSVTISGNHGDTVCMGSAITYSATTTYAGSLSSIAWYKNGVASGIGTTYAFIPADGDWVYCKMHSNFACRTADSALSSPHTINVDTPLTPIVNILARPGFIVKHGQMDTLTALVSNAGPVPAYQWFINGFAIPGATSAYLISDNFENGDSVTCQVWSSGSCAPLMGFNTVSMKVYSVGVVQVNATEMDVKILPNPNKGEFFIKGTLGMASDEDVQAELMDMLGQVVYKHTLTTHNGVINEQVSLSSSLANGMYMLNLRTQEGSKTMQVMIAK